VRDAHGDRIDALRPRRHGGNSDGKGIRAALGRGHPHEVDHARGCSTWSTTWITPFDWRTSAMMMSAISPFSSFTVMLDEPFIISHSLPPLTVFSVAVPLPSRISERRLLVS